MCKTANAGTETGLADTLSGVESSTYIGDRTSAAPEKDPALRSGSTLPARNR
jgi:hypothetical protein